MYTTLSDEVRYLQSVTSKYLSAVRTCLIVHFDYRVLKLPTMQRDTLYRDKAQCVCVCVCCKIRGRDALTAVSKHMHV